MYKFIAILRGIFDNLTLFFIIIIGLIILLIDIPKYENKGYTRELNIVKIISWTYLIFGITMFIIFKLI
ncbi:MAG: hypothetical protein GX023_01605 [Tissierellia bacterium]|nr:hypothetical protein [Tissierellia bacterium]